MEREFQRRLAGSEARYRDALGWVYFHDGQLDQTERQPQNASSLTEPYGAHTREKLYQKYKGTPDVPVLSLDGRDQVDELRRWMEEREFAFPALIDRGYVQEAGMRAYPTTWFLNEEGEIAFVKEGMIQALVQAFSWRIEALRGS